MSSKLQLSLCVPETSSLESLQQFYDSVTAFFLKFPLNYEILFAIESHQIKIRAGLQSYSEKDPRVRVREVSRFQSRSLKLKKLFHESRGDILVASSVDLQIPLGDIFKMLQELYTEPEIQAVFGDRSGKKSAQQPVVRKDPLEVFFQAVISEKIPWPFKDLFCPAFALRKTAFERVAPEIRHTGWHWTLEIQRVVTKFKLKAIEVPVFAGGSTTEKPLQGLKRAIEALRLLSFVVFRI